MLDAAQHQAGEARPRDALGSVDAVQASKLPDILKAEDGGTAVLARHREEPAVYVVGCDFSRGMLEQAQTRSREVPWVRGDAARLPFRDGAFDAIVSTEAFHWFPDQAAALAECRRVLSPGGRLLLALVNTPASSVSAVMHLGSRLVGEPFYWPTVREMRARVESAGFRVERQRRIFRVPGFLLPPVLTCAVRADRSLRDRRSARHAGR